MSDESGGPVPGSVGAEAARLVEAMQGWARETLGEHPQGSGECRFCPVCRLLAAITTDRPDVAARVGEATNAVVAAIRTVLEQVGESPHPGGADDPVGGHRRTVEPIDLTRRT